MSGGAPVERGERGKRDKIAIIGWACRFPGANSPDELWQLLERGIDPIREVPSDRWDAAALYHPSPGVAGRMNSRWGGFLDGVDRFDPSFFGLRPREACSVDPQQRLLLEVAWGALENAAIVPARLAGTRTGVFMGLSNWDYNKITNRDTSYMDAYSGPGTALSVASNRISYTLDLKGPSVTIDTACSSALAAVHFACRSLSSEESTLALVGGVNLILSPETSIVLSQAGVLAGDGRCKTFDARADGFVRSEGCGVLVLKRCSDALRDGDSILGLICGSALNHNGASNGLLAPNGPAQQALLREALADARVAPSDIGLVETQGTGTRLGDLIEVRALAAVLSEGRSAEQGCALSSIKSNIGHTEAVAGIAGIIKVLQCMRHGLVPPNLHLTELSPDIAAVIRDTPFYVPTARGSWPANGRERYGSTSSFGFGGANAHIVLEEAPLPAPRSMKGDGGAHVFMLSARSREALRALAESYAIHLESHPHLALDDVCFTVNTARSRFEHRLCAVCTSLNQLREQLWAHSKGAEARGLWVESSALRGHPRVVISFREGASSEEAAPWLAWGLKAVMSGGSSFDDLDDGLRLDLGPGAVSVYAIRRGVPPRLLATTVGAEDRLCARLECLAVMVARGVELDWGAFHRSAPGRRIALPPYAFQRERYWVGGEAGAFLEARRLSGLSTEERVQVLSSYLRQQLGAVFGWAPRDDADGDRFDLGFDSMLHAEIASRLRRELGIPIAVKDLYAHPRIRSLAAYVAARFDAGSAVSYRESFVDVGGGAIGMCRWGPEGRPAVLLLHGFLDQATAWDGVATHLVEGGFQVIAPELRGHGRSTDAGVGGLSELDLHLSDLATVIRSIGAPPVVWVGHSMGSFLVAIYAHLYPEHVPSLVLVEPVLPVKASGIAALRARLESRAGGLNEFLRTADGSLLARSPLGREDYLTLLHELSGPTRCVYGRESPFRDGDAMVAPDLVARCASEILAGGHNLHVDQPAALAKIILRACRASSERTP